MRRPANTLIYDRLFWTFWKHTLERNESRNKSWTNTPLPETFAYKRKKGSFWISFKEESWRSTKRKQNHQRQSVHGFFTTTYCVLNESQRMKMWMALVQMPRMGTCYGNTRENIDKAKNTYSQWLWWNSPSHYNYIHPRHCTNTEELRGPTTTNRKVLDLYNWLVTLFKMI